MPIRNLTRPSVGAVLYLGAATIAPSTFGAGPGQPQDQLDAVVVTGSRVETTALKALAPVQLIKGDSLRATGERDLRRALASVSPAFSTINFNGGALGKTVGGSSLRGLSGNEVLVLVNGKRRHGSSMINNSGGASLGSSAADLGLIPISAVERVEVLTDGAAAQYGSDAIAGVINVILKSALSGGSADISYGEYNHDVSKVHNLGDAGATSTAGLNSGFALGDNGGFANLSLQYSKIGDVNTVGAWKQPSKSVWQIYAASDDPREATADRHVKDGQYETLPKQETIQAAYNISLPINDTVSLYSFATYSPRNSTAKGSYRSETNATSNIATTPGGYSPDLQTKEEDLQLNLGIKNEALLGWSWDAGLSYGQNQADINVWNTTNASFGSLLSLQNMDAGSLKFTESIASLTAQRDIDTHVFEQPLNVTLGAEYRYNTLALGAGEYYSYANGGYKYPSDYPAANLRDTFAGTGSSFFTGYSPEFEFNKARHNVAYYADFSQQLTDKWNSGLAVRYENYSDFGSALAGKFSNRYQFNQQVAVRGTISNGFRAPSLAEQYYQSALVRPVNDPITNTTYVSYYYDTLRTDAPAARALGAKELKPEKSINFSLGLVFTPTDQLSVSLDAYQIDISDRIYLTGAFNGFNNSSVANALTSAGLTSQQQVRYFANVGDTKTQGAELKLDYDAQYGAYGQAHWSLAYARNKTNVKRINNPAVLANSGLSLLDRERVVLLEEAIPQNTLHGSLNWQLGNVQIQLTQHYYSKTRAVNNVLNKSQDSVTTDAFTTDASISYWVTDNLKATAGANNVFNKRAPDMPDSLASSINEENPTANRNTPWGTNGAFYFARLSYDW
ncbi:TonB-dependent receptor [Pseudomonas sp. 21LCFQ02]|uniref:TonB-dependent receptor plug domain-containing protein n=1 Tax=Pseudomonas sp. 21LCFQ02 TaxID=2957505 RepID=UPI00209AFE69|nr:TonB-dependent receptor [Pseudomonas sp. 21LCFQ02]MCO8167520.1 TonB-dependent receptor [Pseudomonas sp. 21LCFQ02]